MTIFRHKSKRSFHHTKCKASIASLMSVDPAILCLLPSISSTSPSNPPEISLSSLSGGTSAARTQKLTVNDQSTTNSKATESRHYFLKTSSSPDASTIFTGEHVSLSALSTAIPDFCPRPIGHGTYENDARTSFLLTEFIESGGSSSTQSSDHENDEPPLSLAAKIAYLHSLPPSIAEDLEKPGFGFPVTTFCGDTPLDNSWCSTWVEFFAERRLLAIADRFEKLHGKDDELRNIVDRVCSEVVKRLLGNETLCSPHGPPPRLIHGDLWSGNTTIGTLAPSESPSSRPEALTFDPSSFYAHSEFDHGIMSMFPGGTFDSEFWREYFSVKEKDEPKEEYDDRVALYRSWHALNHAVMFGGRGSYRTSALRTLRDLLSKYGTS